MASCQHSQLPAPIVASWRLGAYCKAMQELSGTTQMTLLIFLFGLSAYVFLWFKINPLSDPLSES
jgi:hypothetical protein